MEAATTEISDGSSLNAILCIFIGIFHGLSQMSFDIFYDYSFKTLSLISLVLLVLINGKKWFNRKA